jgi:hypothetical protein
MRPLTALLVIALVVCAGIPAGALAGDSGSISRDARGPQPAGDYGPLGSPPSPAIFVLSQTTIFMIGVTLLLVAAVLGAYTFTTSRRRQT